MRMALKQAWRGMQRGWSTQIWTWFLLASALMVPLLETTMSIVQRFCSNGIDWLADGPIGPYVDAFKQHLTERRYAAHTLAGYLAGITHFARWARSRRLRLRRIDEGSITEFLDDHLPNCNCAGPTRHDRRDLSAALGHLLVVLRAQGAVAPPIAGTTAVEAELLRYDQYMEHARGLAPKTRDMALRIVGRLLAARFGDGAIDIPAIKPEHVRRFFAQQAELYSKPASAGSVVASLRGYFRYRASLGDLVHGLVGAVSYPANWSLSSLPKTLTAEEVEQLVGSLGQPGRSMRRADAIAAYLKHERPGPPYTRSHLLRHTMANRLLAGGSSLKEVADVLRYRSLNTTMIYAKLDSRKLAEVALPWPGSAA